MNVRPHWINDQIAVNGQIGPENVDQIKKLGFKSIICNRPDFENDPSQPTFKSIHTKAETLDLESKFLPVSSNNQTKENAMQMSDLLNNLPKPIFVYCRTGGRSASLIGLSVHLGMFNI